MNSTNQSSKPFVTSKRPWYKHGLLWFVIFIPFLAVVVSFTLIFIATKNADSVVKDNWYMDGKALRQDLSMDVRAYQQGLKAIITIKDDLKPEITLSATTLQTPFPDSLTFSLFHATIPNLDQVIQVQQDQPAHYSGTLKKKVAPGKYHVELLYSQHWRLQKKVRLPVASDNFELVPLETMRYATQEELTPLPTGY